MKGILRAATISSVIGFLIAVGVSSAVKTDNTLLKGGLAGGIFIWGYGLGDITRICKQLEEEEKEKG